MTHQPPIPEANRSPYPLHPAPIPEEVKQRHAAEAAEATRAREQESGVSKASLGIGAAIAAGAAAAAVTGLLYARRRSANGTEKTGKAKRTGGDDKSKRGGSDRKRVAASEPYEVSYFARKHGISAEEARAIIKEAGPDREAANALAGRRKTS